LILKKFINLKRVYKSLILALIDFLILQFAIWSSFSLRFEEFYSYQNINLKYLSILIILFFFIQHKNKIYNIPSRSFNSSIVYTILKNAFISCLIFGLINTQLYNVYNVPRSIPIVIFFILASLIILKHSLIINFFYLFKKIIQKTNSNILIYGFNNQAFSIGEDLKRNVTYNFIGYADTYEPKGKIFDNFHKLQKISDLINIIKKKNITHLAISKKLNYKKKIYYLKLFKDLNLRVIFLDDTYNINNLGYNNVKFRPEYNDILDRLNLNHLENLKKDEIFANKVILITGAGGSIGSELSYKLLHLNLKKIILIDVSEISLHNLKQKIQYHSKFNSKKVEFKLLNLIDYNILENIFFNNKIDFIFHAAAYKHVNIVETNSQFGLKNNILITKNICQLALKYKVKTNVLISTDKAVNPKNIMGLSKRICENIFKLHSKNTSKLKFIVTRFGNVIGSSGSVLPIFRDCIENNLPISVTSKKATRYVMTIDEACSLVIKSSIIGENGNFYVFDMGKPLNVFNLAKLFINMYGLRYKIFLKKNCKNNLNDFISICLIGLKKGEKLHEELAYKKDLVPTQFKKILISKEMFLELEKNFETKLHNIIKILDSKNQNDTVKFLKKMI